jgi:hypothetical protein
MQDPNDVFGIFKYEGWTANNRQIYGVRGIGSTYSDFWQDFKNWHAIWERDDWPWSYIALSEKDEADLIAKYGKYIYDQPLEDEPFDELDTLPDIQAEEDKEIAKILAEEIRKEIDKEIIAKILRP